MKEQRIRAGIVVVAAVFVSMAVGCSSTSDDPATAPSDQTAAADAAKSKSEFWDAFNGGKIADVEPARDHMIAAFAAQPKDDELARWIGFSSILPFVEQAPGAPLDQAKLATRGQEAVKYTGLAVDLATDPRMKLYNTGFYAGMLYGQGGESETTAEARTKLEEVIKGIPAFGLLARADVMSGAAKDSKDFATALESYYRFYEQCSGAKLDRAHPDVTPVLAKPTDPDTTCTSSSHVPHAIQGGLLNFADSLVKNGQVDAARPVYEVIKRTEGYATWSFAKVVDERLASDLNARAAQYAAGGDPRSQPRVGAGCLGCHQR